MSSETYTITEERELVSLTREILKIFPVRVFALSGDLGAGKTTMIRYFCNALNVEDIVQSPTFSLINEYSSARGPVYHMDLYRIEQPEEVFDFGYEEYFYSGNYCFVEWPEIIEDLLPANTAWIRISVAGRGQRKIIVTSDKNT